MYKVIIEIIDASESVGITVDTKDEAEMAFQIMSEQKYDRSVDIRLTERGRTIDSKTIKV